MTGWVVVGWGGLTARLLQQRRQVVRRLRDPPSMIVLVSALAVALVAALLVSLRARAAERAARAALDAERRARAADAETSAELRAQLEASWSGRLADLERVTREKVELLTSGREELRTEMQAISSEVLKGATEQITKLTAEARRADAEAAKGELSL